MYIEEIVIKYEFVISLHFTINNIILHINRLSHAHKMINRLQEYRHTAEIVNKVEYVGGLT